MTEQDIKTIKGLLGAIYTVLLVMMGTLLQPIYGATYSWIAVVVMIFYSVYQAEKFW